MNKIKNFFKYLWEGLYNRLSIAILNVFYAITFSLSAKVWYEGCHASSDVLGHAFFIFFSYIFDVILTFVLLIRFVYENKHKEKRIRNNPVINNAIYKVISIISVIRVVFTFAAAILLIGWYVNVILEDYIRYWR